MSDRTIPWLVSCSYIVCAYEITLLSVCLLTPDARMPEYLSQKRAVRKQRLDRHVLILIKFIYVQIEQPGGQL
jgi:hypothetical protein